MNISNLKCRCSVGDSDAERINNEGICKFKKGDFEGALERFNTSIGENPKLTEVYYNRSITYINLSILDFIYSISSATDPGRSKSQIVADFHHFIENVIK